MTMDLSKSLDVIMLSAKPVILCTILEDSSFLHINKNKYFFVLHD